MTVSDAEYKALKEAWVTGLSGGSYPEILLVLCVIPVSILFQHTVINPLIHARIAGIRSQGVQQALMFVVDYAACVFPLVLAFTKTETTIPMLLCLLLLSLTTAMLTTFGRRSLVNADSKAAILEKSLNSSKNKRFVLWYRSAMMISTCVAILAVDFPIFPRRFAKTELFGLSLMDAGVGSVIVASGLVGGGVSKISYVRKITSATLALLPVIAIGLARFVAVKLTDYQEHVSEYGVHWNFFLTIGFVGILDTIIAIPVHLKGPFAMIVGVAYEVALQGLGVQNYLFNAPRDSFFSKNREGIVTLIGYYVLLIGSQYIGSVLLQNRKSMEEWWSKFKTSILICITLFVAIRFTGDLLPPSRRLCNLGYIVEVLLGNVFIVTLCLAVDLLVAVPTPIIASPLKMPHSAKEKFPSVLIDEHVQFFGNSILGSVSGRRNSQLVVFLLANIMTGVINLSMRTLFATDAISFIVINAYMTAVSLVSLLAPTLLNLSSAVF